MFVHTKGNNRQSEQILEDNVDHMEGQCRKILWMLQGGRRLTVRDMFLMGIGDPRRRIKDIRDKGIEIKDEILEGRFKVYYI